jgi:hypothetical protein
MGASGSAVVVTVMPVCTVSVKLASALRPPNRSRRSSPGRSPSPSACPRSPRSDARDEHQIRRQPRGQPEPAHGLLVAAADGLDALHVGPPLEGLRQRRGHEEGRTVAPRRGGRGNTLCRVLGVHGLRHRAGGHGEHPASRALAFRSGVVQVQIGDDPRPLFLCYTLEPPGEPSRARRPRRRRARRARSGGQPRSGCRVFMPEPQTLERWTAVLSKSAGSADPFDGVLRMQRPIRCTRRPSGRSRPSRPSSSARSSWACAPGPRSRSAASDRAGTDATLISRAEVRNPSSTRHNTRNVVNSPCGLMHIVDSPAAVCAHFP